MQTVTDKNWCQFVNKMLARPTPLRTLFVVEGDAYPHCQGHTPFCEPFRHVKKTPVGIVRQIKKDGCMKERNIRVYEIDLSKCIPIYEGKL